MMAASSLAHYSLSSTSIVVLQVTAGLPAPSWWTAVTDEKNLSQAFDYLSEVVFVAPGVSSTSPLDPPKACPMPPGGRYV